MYIKLIENNELDVEKRVWGWNRGVQLDMKGACIGCWDVGG